MSEIILLYRPQPSVKGLCESLDAQFKIHCAQNLGEIISFVEQGNAPKIVILDHLDIESNENILLHLYTLTPGAVFILTCQENNLSHGVQLANQQSFFRVLTEKTDALTFDQILLDARTQYNSVNHIVKNSPLDLADPLTGCANRANIFQNLSRQVARATRYAQHISLIVCDIDGLKNINDFIGYNAGDNLLRHFASHINNQIRKGIDAAGRWGDDSFLIICPETALAGAGKLAERLKTTLNQNKMYHNDKVVKIRASYGISSYAPEYPDHNNNADQLILLAERCLMQAKAAGGDTILCCP